jgi:hypothetical protein
MSRTRTDSLSLMRQFARLPIAVQREVAQNMSVAFLLRILAVRPDEPPRIAAADARRDIANDIRDRRQEEREQRKVRSGESADSRLEPIELHPLHLSVA